MTKTSEFRPWTRTQASGFGPPASSLQPPASSLQPPAPASNLQPQPPTSNLQPPVSSLQHPALIRSSRSLTMIESMDKTFMFIGALMGGIGVAIGAFGAHGPRGRLSPEMLAV